MSLINIKSYKWLILSLVLSFAFKFAVAATNLNANTHKNLNTKILTNNSRVYFGSDFFIETVKNNSSLKEIYTQNSILSEENCRDHIQKVLCLVDPAPYDQNDLKRTCLPGGEAYAHFFEKLYDNYPSVVQKIFCSLKVIYIEKEFIGTAYAGLVKDEKENIIGAKLGIRKSVLDENLDLTTWATWKEQLSFGGVVNSYNASLSFPFIETKSKKLDVSDFLYFVIAHEFGHIFDFANNLNQTTSCTKISEKEEECVMAPNSWGGISWITNKLPKPENEFANRKGLCFYWCNGKGMDLSLAENLYSSLYKTNFISIYATTQPWDDFADSLAYYLMNQNLGLQYTIHVNQKLNFDIIAKLNSPLWEQKFNYITNFLSKKDIIYP